MKKVLLLLFLCICVSASAQEFNFGGIFYQILDPDAKTCTTKIGTLLSSGNSVDWTDLTLPAHPVYEEEVYTLTEIGDCSFMGGNLQSVTIPNTVTRIGEWAFCRQQELTSIYIPGNVEIIDNWAFSNCLNLSEVVLSYGIKVLGHSVFRYCKSIHELTLPASVETIKGFLWGQESDCVGGYYQLEALICESYAPPKIKLVPSYSVPWFTDTNPQTILYVPYGARENYLSASGWQNYGADRIMEIDTAILFLYRQTATIARGATLNLEYVYTYNSSNAGYAAGSINWESSDESVATVEFGRRPDGKAIGIVHGVAPGTARITLSVQPNSLSHEPLTAYCDVTVKEGIISFTLSEKEMTLVQNESQQLIVDILGLEPGTSTLTVTLENDKGEKISETCDITVVEALTDVTNLFSDPEETSVNIYNIAGELMMQNVSPETVLTLSPGLYIVGNKKVLVR